MRYALFLMILISMVLTACQAGPAPVTGGAAKTPAVAVAASETTRPSATATQTPVPPTATVTPSPTVTASATPTPEPAGLIRVDTLDQEIYPFVEDGDCSLSEAISAANLLQAVDGCPAGVEEQTIIELMPGTYRLTQLDPTPQQVMWAIHTSPAGSALPPIVRSVTIQGSGAVLSREDAGDVPFRVLEVLYGTVELRDLTIQGGETGTMAWGGGILVNNASLVMERVTVQNNRADSGGGLYIFDGGLTIRESHFLNNEAVAFGGGLYMSESRAEISGSRFVENISGLTGGGLYAYKMTLAITDTLLLENENRGNFGGGLYAELVNVTILRSQFYRNISGERGGAVAMLNYPTDEQAAELEAGVEEQIADSEFLRDMETEVPGLRETLAADPSGSSLPLRLDAQIHESCFKSNVTHYPGFANWSSAIYGRSNAENNYFGDPSGPGGEWSGTGDQITRSVKFQPYLSEPPAHCDLSLVNP